MTATATVTAVRPGARGRCAEGAQVGGRPGWHPLPLNPLLPRERRARAGQTPAALPPAQRVRAGGVTSSRGSPRPPPPPGGAAPPPRPGRRLGAGGGGSAWPPRPRTSLQFGGRRGSGAERGLRVPCRRVHGARAALSPARGAVLGAPARGCRAAGGLKPRPRRAARTRGRGCRPGGPCAGTARPWDPTAPALARPVWGRTSHSDPAS